MRQAPIGWRPDQAMGTVHNGQAARALHARDVDRQATHLAVRKWTHPLPIADRFDSTVDPIEFTVLCPAFTPHVEICYLASGRGSVTATCTDDAWNAVTQIYAGTGASGTHSIAEAIETWTGPPLTGVGANGSDRALDVSFRRAPREIRLSLTIADYSGSQTLRLYGVRVRGWWPDETALLTTAT